MSPFSDPKMERRKDQYFKRNRDPQFLYQGPQEAIVKELKAWVVRRKEVAREQIALKDKLQDSTRELIRYGPILNGPIEPRELEARNTKAMDILRRDADTDSRFTVLENENGQDTARAEYLLHTLRSRGVTWPELWWRPEDDGGVCSFLGTVDDTFDARATLTALEARADEDRVQAGRLELLAQMRATWAQSAAQSRGQPAKEDPGATTGAAAKENSGADGGEASTARPQPSASAGSGSGGAAAASSGVKPAAEKLDVDKLKKSLVATFASDDFGDTPVRDSSESNTSTQGKPAVRKTPEKKLGKSLAAAFASEDFSEGRVGGGSGSKTSAPEKKRPEAGKKSEGKGKS